MREGVGVVWELGGEGGWNQFQAKAGGWVEFGLD
ncbi:unnamed protein product [Anisakis simplex]|uniref:Fibrinogen C-terminal domain-containing protein n=1 Tax=Anisakis simplex TaxID=6269 RepID=A0A0M3J458_ANISI|nr:unnamed protein product [Anisakis simplex]